MCKYCGSHEVVRHGKNRGHQRWLCKSCGRKFIDSKKACAEDVLVLYQSGRYSAKDISERLDISERTVFRYLSRTTISENFADTNGREVVVLMDASYWGRNFGVVILKDNISGKVLWYKFIDHKERIDDYAEGIEYLEHNNFIIRGIVSDGLKGLRTRFSQYKFQHCQFHQIQTVKLKLTNNPKTQAAIELLHLVKLMCHTDKESFIGLFNEWECKWSDFLKEKSTNEDGKSSYKHQRLRSAWLSVKHNMEWLWTFYDNPKLKLPNTNNAMEGLNSSIKDKLRRHKGISVVRRKELIIEVLKAHNPKR